MTGTEQPDHRIENAIHRWENEGGAVPAHDRANASNRYREERMQTPKTGYSNSSRDTF